MNFKLEILANFEIFGGIKFVNKLFIKLLYFIRVSNLNRNRKAEITSFGKKLVQRSQKNSQPTKKLNAAFDKLMDFVLNGKD